MKWSDGQPFTADDFLFWYEDLYQNKDLYPNPAPSMTINTKPIAMEKVDATTVRYTFPDAYHSFPEVLASGQAPGAGEAQFGRTIESGYAPAHYLKQFLPKYTPQAQLDQMAKDAHVDTWTQLFILKNDWALNPDLPVVTAWKTVQPSNTNTWTLERNPYSIWVDTAGNQLPYIDNLQLTLAQNLEAANLQAISGAVDYQERHLDLTKVPVFLQNQQKNGYKLYLDPAPNGGDSPISFNLSYDKDPEIATWFATTDFRRALSLGVERDQLNQTFWLGLGTPGSVAPAESTRYSPGPEYRTLWSTYDPNTANQMLDKLGLDKRGPDGLRLRSDGSGPLRLQVMTFAGQFMQFTKISEMIAEQWKKLGIDLQVQEVERGLGLTRVRNNDFQLWAWANDTSEDLFTTIHVVPVSVETGRSPMYGLWFITNGAKGKEPSPRVKEAMDLYRKGPGVPDDERTALGKEIWKIALDEVWHIGTVGLSPAMSGVRVAKVNMGNVPSRQFNSNIVRTPGGSRPETFFWKS
jgi:peptide/nickel transport system substrate-binding protein